MESVNLEHPAAGTASTEVPQYSSQAVLPRDSAALRRLMEEVRYEDLNVSSAAAAYNRQHNRHNR